MRGHHQQPRRPRRGPPGPDSPRVGMSRPRHAHCHTRCHTTWQEGGHGDLRHETPQGEKERAPSTASAASSRAPRARLTTRRNVASKTRALAYRLPYTMARGRAWRLETLLYKPRVLQLVCRSYHRSTFARVFDTAVDLLGKRFLSIYSLFTSLFMQRTIRHPHESTFYTVPAMGHSRRGV